MSQEHSGQWPGPPPAAERKAAEAEENLADRAPETAPEQDAAARVDETGTSAPGAPGGPGAAEAPGEPGGTGGTEAPGAPGSTGTADAPAMLLDPAHTEEFRRRWDAIKASFVDDPDEALQSAERLADEVVAELTQAVDARRRDLAERREGVAGQDDKTRTERLRVVLHGYHGVLDPVLRI
jgi:hypothetical protein